MLRLQGLKKGRIEALMGIFATQKTLDRLEDRLKTLEDLCAEQHREARKLDLEFTDLYDKVRHQMSRMAKRDARAAKENGADIGGELTPDDDLTVDPISRSILARRKKRVFSP